MTLDPATLAYDDDGLVACICQDAATGDVLMLAWATREAVERTLATGRAWFWSRSRGELWETVWAKPGEHEPEFMPWPLASGHHPTFCVWELRAVCHEQSAWSRYLRSPRRAGDMEAYLADTYTGPA